MARKKQKMTYKYECSLTGETFITTRQSDNPDELISVKAYYELNPEQDDRPETEKIKQEQNN